MQPPETGDVIAESIELVPFLGKARQLRREHVVQIARSLRLVGVAWQGLGVISSIELSFDVLVIPNPDEASPGSWRGQTGHGVALIRRPDFVVSCGGAAGVGRRESGIFLGLSLIINAMQERCCKSERFCSDVSLDTKEAVFLSIFTYRAATTGPNSIVGGG